MPKLDPKAASAAVAAMLAIATPFVASWEGIVLKPHWDRFGKVWDICYGETSVPMREYTKAECDQLLAKRLAWFAEEVRKLSPGIDKSPETWASHASFAYNNGVQAYANSSVRRLFNAGNRVGACKAMGLYKYSGGKVVRGLVFRRQGDGKRMGEIELCMIGARK